MAARARCRGTGVAEDARGHRYPGYPSLRPGQGHRGARGLAEAEGGRSWPARPAGGGVKAATRNKTDAPAQVPCRGVDWRLMEAAALTLTLGYPYVVPKRFEADVQGRLVPDQ